MGQGSVKRAAFSRDSGGEDKVWMAVKTTRPMGGTQRTGAFADRGGRVERRQELLFQIFEGFEPPVSLLSWQIVFVYTKGEKLGQ